MKPESSNAESPWLGVLTALAVSVLVLSPFLGVVQQKMREATKAKPSHQAGNLVVLQTVVAGDLLLCESPMKDKVSAFLVRSNKEGVITGVDITMYKAERRLMPGMHDELADAECSLRIEKGPTSHETIGRIITSGLAIKPLAGVDTK